MGAPTGVCPKHGDFQIGVEHPGELAFPLECPACTLVELRAAKRKIRTVRKRVSAMSVCMDMKAASPSIWAVPASTRPWYATARRM